MSERLATLSFDDGGWQDFHVVEVLNQFRVPATFYLPAGALSRLHFHCRPEELPGRYKGHEIGCHSWSHAEPEEALCEYQREVVEARQELRRQFDQPVECFAFPYGQPAPGLEFALERAGFRWARTAVACANDLRMPHARFRQPITAMLHVPESYMPAAYAAFPHLHFVAHSYDLHERRLEPALARLIMSCRGLGMRFVTNSEFFAAMETAGA